MTETDKIHVDSLTRTLLAGQEEPENLSVPPLGHWVDLLERRSSLSVRDKAYLAISPLSRARHAVAQDRFRMAYLERAANRNNALVMQAAASSTGRQRMRFAPMNDFTVAIEPSGPQSWLILCDVREGFPRGSQVELVDREGRVWLSGVPNEDGRIVARHDGVANPLEGHEPFVIRLDGIELG